MLCYTSIVCKQLLLPLWKNKRGQRRRKAWAGGGREMGGNREEIKEETVK